MTLRPKELDLEKVKEAAAKIDEGLKFFAFTQSPDPEKQRALDRLSELMYEIFDLLAILTSGVREFRDYRKGVHVDHTTEAGP